MERKRNTPPRSAAHFSPYGTRLTRRSGPTARSVIEESYRISVIETKGGWARIRGPKTLEGFVNAMQPINKRGSLFTDVQHVDRVLASVRGYASAAASILPDEMKTSETDALDKFCLVGADPLPYWFVDSFSDVGVSSAAILTEITDALREFTADVTEHFVPTASDMADPYTTQPASPSFTSGLEARLELIQRAEGLWKPSRKDSLYRSSLQVEIPLDVYHRVDRLATMYGEEPITMWCSIVGRRSGPNRRVRDFFELSNGIVAQTHEIEGYPRDRHIFMVPYLLNLLLSPAYEVYLRHFKKSRQTFFGGDHLLTMATTRAQVVPGTLHEVDISGMDRTFPDALTGAMNGLIEHLASIRGNPLPDLTHQLLDGLHWLGTLIPNVETNSASVGWLCLPHKPVGRYSGIKLTSAYNTMASLGIALVGLKRSGVITRVADLNSSVLLWVQGDDVLVGLLDPSKKAAYGRFLNTLSDLYSEAGFEAEPAPGNTFLMRHWTDEGDDLPVIARVLQTTISPERPRSDPDVRIIGQCARTDKWERLVKSFPAPYVEGAVDVLREYDPGLAELTVLPPDAKKRALLAATERYTRAVAARRDERELLDLIDAERYGRTGAELLAAITINPELMAIVEADSLIKEGLFLYARKTVGPTPFPL